MIWWNLILSDLVEYSKTIFNNQVIWNVLPLILATLVMVVYFQKYREERSGWNDYVANSLVLLFVAVNLFRHIYYLDIPGAYNFIDYSSKSIAVIFVLLIGMIIVRFNFEHILPEKISRYISSPLTVNLIAFIIILYVQASIKNSWHAFVSLLIIYLILTSILNLIKIPIRKFFEYMQKLKSKEEIEDVKQRKFEIEEMEKQLKDKKNILEKSILKKAENEKKQSIKIKKIIKS